MGITTKLNVPQVREGVLMVDNKPQWIVVETLNEDPHYISCFNISKDSLLDYEKTHNIKVLKRNFRLKPVKVRPYGDKPKTKLAELAFKKYEKEHPTIPKHISYQRPLFTTVVIPDGEDTFTGDVGPGFYEHEPTKTRLITIKGDKTSQRVLGESTNVFLSLTRVSWLRTLVPKDGLGEMLMNEADVLLNVIS